MNLQMERTAHIPYKFLRTSLTSGSGDLTGIPFTPVLISFTDYSSSSHGYAQDLCHKNYPPCMFLDMAADVGNEYSSNYDAIVHQGHKKLQTVTEYLDELASKRLTPVMGHRVAGENHYYPYVPDEYKIIIKELLDFMSHMHSRDESFEHPISFNNLMFYGGSLRVFGFSVCRATSTTKMNDFQNIRGLIDQLFGGHRQYVPREMETLLNIMDSPQSFDLESLMVNHIGIMTHRERITFAISCSDKENFLYGALDKKLRNCYRDAVRNMGKLDGWKAKFRNAAKPAVACFKGAHKSYVDKNDSIYAINRQLLKCCRNLGTHMSEHCRASRILFGEKDIDLIIMSIFGEELMLFQKLLHERGLLIMFT